MEPVKPMRTAATFRGVMEPVKPSPVARPIDLLSVPSSESPFPGPSVPGHYSSIMDVVELTRELVNIPSVTNDEGRVGAFIAERLETQGRSVVVQTVPPEGGVTPEHPRLNVLATAEPGIVPDVVLTTHLDTVPPFIACSEDDDFLYGRGTCDAKGIFAAQWVAAHQLWEAGHRTVALLGVAGEETDSVGAKMVSEILPRAGWIIDGEPTDGLPAAGAKGILALSVTARGQATHSAYPERGHSATHDLIRGLARLLQAELPGHPQFGATTVNVGVVEGGVAPNVLAPSASAAVLIRLAAPAEQVLEVVRAQLGSDLGVEVTSRSEPHEIFVPDGQPSGLIVKFGSDVPYLSRIGRPLLVGPGSIHDAHTSHEKVGKQALRDAVDQYVAFAEALLP